MIGRRKFIFDVAKGLIVPFVAPQIIRAQVVPNRRLNFQPVSSGSFTSFVTGQTVGTTGNNFTGRLGMQFTIGAVNVAMKTLGAYNVTAGNSQTHTVYLMDTGTTVLASASVNFSGAGVGWVYSSAVFTLVALTSYSIVTDFTSGGDSWGDTTPITVTAVATVIGARYFDTSFHGSGGVNTCYTPCGFQYQ